MNGQEDLPDGIDPAGGGQAHDCRYDGEGGQKSIAEMIDLTDRLSHQSGRHVHHDQAHQFERLDDANA